MEYIENGQPHLQRLLCYRARRLAGIGINWRSFLAIHHHITHAFDNVRPTGPAVSCISYSGGAKCCISTSPLGKTICSRLSKQFPGCPRSTRLPVPPTRTPGKPAIEQRALSACRNLMVPAIGRPLRPPPPRITPFSVAPTRTSSDLFRTLAHPRHPRRHDSSLGNRHRCVLYRPLRNQYAKFRSVYDG